MRRATIRSLVALFLISLALLVPQSGEGGCKGTCFGPPPTPPPEGSTPTPTPTPLPPDYTPSPEERCEIVGGSVSVLAFAEIEPGSGPPLCFMEVALGPGASSQSLTDPGGVETYYVQAGTIAFRLDTFANSGMVRVVPGPGDEPPALEQLPDGSYQATSGDEFTISAGGAVSVDLQEGQVAMEYSNAGGEAATLLISSALPGQVSEATPEP